MKHKAMKNSLQDLVAQMDIYLLDQIMKGRYHKGETILDAGCGGGRNMYWFLNEGFEIYGVDVNSSSIANLKSQHSYLPENRFQIAALEGLPFKNAYFDHIICSAVLHFSETTPSFFESLKELIRVLKTGGSLFIRMTSDVGIEDKVIPAAQGNYYIPDGSKRFLLTKNLLKYCLDTYPIELAEPFKTVNVEDMRCMSTIVFKKTG